MNPLELKHLRDFCEKHEIDTAWIDDSLSYEENKLELEKFVPKTDYGNLSLLRESKRELDLLEQSYEAYVSSLTLEEQYALTEEQIEALPTPFLFFNFYFRCPYTKAGYLKDRLKPFSRVMTWTGRYYFTVRGTRNEILAVVAMLPPFVKLIGRNLEWQRNVRFTCKVTRQGYMSGGKWVHGESEARWLKLPDIGIPLRVQY